VVGFASILQGQPMSVNYKHHHFPIEIIRYCVWLYYTFPLSYRDIEKRMNPSASGAKSLLKLTPIRFGTVVPSLLINGIWTRG
jgi:hypothetical protein